MWRQAKYNVFFCFVSLRLFCSVRTHTRSWPYIPSPCPLFSPQAPDFLFPPVLLPNLTVRLVMRLLPLKTPDDDDDVFSPKLSCYDSLFLVAFFAAHIHCFSLFSRHGFMRCHKRWKKEQHTSTGEEKNVERSRSWAELAKNIFAV